MTQQEIERIITVQREFYRSGTTKNLEYRIKALRKLKKSIKSHEADIAAALKADLGKSATESYMCETGLVQSEISYMLKHIGELSCEKTVPTPLAQFCSRSYKKPSPYGTVLIMSPWNYPFLLTFDPLVDALAAGNTVVLKPSAYSPNTSALMSQIIAECFSEKYVTVVTGGRAENTALLDADFDYIFFTGSKTVGREVMRKASVHLTPITLELGGKSPCIVEKTANLKLAAKRIVFGKFLNCGQTCVAPDYIYCDATIKDKLLAEIKDQIMKQFGRSPLYNKDYGKIINQKHYDRICGLIDEDKVVWGNAKDEETLRIAPTVMDDVTFDDKIMQEEIFGPVLPILTYQDLDEAIAKINSLPDPLALYIFTNSKKTANKVIQSCSFGGGCINDVVIHLATSYMPFGGVGESGMGCYHGREGYKTFSHQKSIVDKKTWMDLPMRYQPYKKINDQLIHLFIH